MVICLTSVGLSGLGVPYILNVGLWALAAGSAFTFGQRVRARYIRQRKRWQVPGIRVALPGDQMT